MVSILPSGTPSSLISEDVGRALQSVLPQAVNKGYERGLIQKGLNSMQNMSPDQMRNMSPTQLVSSVLGSFAGTEQGAQYAKSIMPFMLEQLRISKEQNANYGGNPEQDSQLRNRNDVPQMPQKMEQPSFMGQNNKSNQGNPFFPSNIGPNDAPGNLPQEASSNLQIEPLFTRDQKISKAKQLSKELNIPFSESMKIVNEGEADKKEIRNEIESDRKNRVSSQREYGEKGQAELLRLNPNSTSEQQAVFKKKAEEIAGKGNSEADIDRSIALEASRFRNMIKSVEDTMSVPRITNALQRKMIGNEKDFKQAASDVRVKIKPLLDAGLYDTARLLLDGLGYYPEELEYIVQPLNDQSNTIIKNTPDAIYKNKPEDLAGGKTPSFFMPYEYPQNSKDNLKSGLQELLKQNPNTNLILARKGFEDKDYDWRVFKDVINEMIESGEFVPTHDQEKHINSKLDEPPLNNLQKMLHGLNLIGR